MIRRADDWSNGLRAAVPSVAAEVQDFYQRYPYPRLVSDLGGYRLRWQDSSRRRADYHLFWPATPFKENHTILVAGCGTSQAAKHALRWPNAKVTGIDFSAGSVRCTEGLKHKYNLSNLEVQQLPIEHVGELQKTFDQIVCTGVLHHLEDPDAALRALRDVLEPDGAMQLMVYAPYGRAGVYMLQEFCRLVGVPASEDGIRELIAALEECRRDIRSLACCATLRTSGARRHWPTRCFTLRIAPTRCRNCSSFSSGRTSASAAG